MHVHCSTIRQINNMKSRLPLFTLTKLFLLVILLSGTLVEPRKKTGKVNQLQSRSSKYSSPKLRSAQSSESVTFDAQTMNELVCGSNWFKNLFDRNLPQRLLPLSNNDTDNLIWDVVNVLGEKYYVSENLHTETTNETIIWLLENHRFWSKLTEYTPDHELYDEIWKSFTWRDPTKGFATSKDALNFLGFLQMTLKSSNQIPALTMLMDFFDQSMYFDNNNPRFRSFPLSKTGDSFLSNIELPERISSLMPRDTSIVKSIEEAQNVVYFDRANLMFGLRIVNVTILNLQLINRRCQSYSITTPAAAEKSVVCGESLQTARILTGENARRGAWPWIVFIVIEGIMKTRNFTGVLISDTHVLTVARGFVRNSTPKDIKVYIGEFNKDDFNYSATVHKVEKVFVHENYVEGYGDDDTAIIKLKEKVIFDNNRRPICLPPPNINLDGKVASIAGWEEINYHHPSASRRLKEVDSVILENADCRIHLGNFGYYITEKRICVGAKEHHYLHGRSSCQSDSGEPVMYQTTSGQWIVVGLATWIFPTPGGYFDEGLKDYCTPDHFPSVATRVSSHLDWINAKLML